MKPENLKALGLKAKTKCYFCLENRNWRLVIIGVAGFFAAFLIIVIYELLKGIIFGY